MKIKTMNEMSCLFHNDKCNKLFITIHSDMLNLCYAIIINPQHARAMVTVVCVCLFTI